MIELVYFGGCPHVEQARQALRTALREMGRAAEWAEWDQDHPDTPARVQGYGSPTVLLDGRDIRGSHPGAAGRSCRADGPPTLNEVREALSRL